MRKSDKAINAAAARVDAAMRRPKVAADGAPYRPAEAGTVVAARPNPAMFPIPAGRGHRNSAYAWRSILNHNAQYRSG
jgi:hypothetical protein